MMRQVNWIATIVGVGLGILLLTAILMLMQLSTPAPTMAGTTDAIAEALNSARVQGLQGDPSEMYIVRGPYSELKGPMYGKSPDDKRTVWVIWIKGSYKLTAPGVHDMPVTNTYIYIDAKTGQEFQTAAAKVPLKGLELKPWRKVSKADIGKFPIPVYNYTTQAEAEPAQNYPTPTLLKPGK